MTPAAIEARLAGRAAAWPLLDLGCYADANPDLAHVDALEHFARHGLWEGRLQIAEERSWARVAALACAAPGPSPLTSAALARALRAADALRVRLWLAPEAPARAVEAAAHVARLLEGLGAAAQVDRSDAALPPTDPGSFELWVDPAGPARDSGASPEIRARLAGAGVLLTGAIAHAGMRELQPAVLLAAGVVAMTPETQAVCAAAGIPALWTPPPLATSPPEPPPAWAAPLDPEVASAPADLPWAERPIEVAVLELLTVRREIVWGPLADAVGRRRNLVLAPRFRTGCDPDADAPLRRFALARARVSLHLHGGEPTSPDWLAVCAEAVALGAAVVCESGLPHPVLDPRRHLFEEAPRRMPELIRWLLDTPDGRLEAGARARSARDALRAAADPLEAGAALVAFLHRLSREPGR